MLEATEVETVVASNMLNRLEVEGSGVGVDVEVAVEEPLDIVAITSDVVLNWMVGLVVTALILMAARQPTRGTRRVFPF